MFIARLRRVVARTSLKLGPEGGIAGFLFLAATLVGVFVGAIVIFNTAWWFALLLAGVSVMLVAAVRYLFMRPQAGESERDD